MYRLSQLSKVCLSVDARQGRFGTPDPPILGVCLRPHGLPAHRPRVRVSGDYRDVDQGLAVVHSYRSANGKTTRRADITKAIRRVFEGCESTTRGVGVEGQSYRMKDRIDRS